MNVGIIGKNVPFFEAGTDNYKHVVIIYIPIYHDRIKTTWNAGKEVILTKSLNI